MTAGFAELNLVTQVTEEPEVIEVPLLCGPNPEMPEGPSRMVGRLGLDGKALQDLRRVGLGAASLALPLMLLFSQRS